MAARKGGVDYRTSTGVGHQYIPAPVNTDRQLRFVEQIECWWPRGGSCGLSEYSANYAKNSSSAPRRDLGAAALYAPRLLRPETMEHFAGAGYARRVRTPASSIFPGKMEPWCSETMRSFVPVSSRQQTGGIARKDGLTLWDAEMYPRAWGFGRQDTWICPSYLAQDPMRDTRRFQAHSKPRNVPPLVFKTPNKGMQTEFQHAYQGRPGRYQGPAEVGHSSMDVIPKLMPHEILLAPDTYKPESTMYGSKKPTIAWVN